MEQLSVRPFWFSTHPNSENAPIGILPIHNCSSIVPRNNSLLLCSCLSINNPQSKIKNLLPPIRFFFDTYNEYRPQRGISYTSGSTCLRKSRLSLFFCLFPPHLLPFLITRNSYPYPGPSLFLLFGPGATWPPLAPWNILPSWKTLQAWASF